MGTVSWAFGAWLGLIGLQAATSPSAPQRIRSLFAGATALLDRVLDPTLPLIPDLRTKE
jgi:hypothetical protein